MCRKLDQFKFKYGLLKSTREITHLGNLHCCKGLGYKIIIHVNLQMLCCWGAGLPLTLYTWMNTQNTYTNNRYYLIFDSAAFSLEKISLVIIVWNYILYSDVELVTRKVYGKTCTIQCGLTIYASTWIIQLIIFDWNDLRWLMTVFIFKM